MQYILEVQQVSKSYKKKKVIDNVSFNIKRGEVVGLVGPNGAGKTTLMKIIMNLIQNYQGTIKLEEHKKRKKQIGAIIENPSFYPNLSGMENLKYFAEVSGGYDEEHVRSIIKMMKIDGFINKKVKNYSLGMKQRLGIAQSLLNNPDFLILDEPTNGLDPEGVVEIRNIIAEIVRTKNISVLISSHILSEIENLCDRVLFLKNGSLMHALDLKNEENAKQIYVIETRQSQDIKKFLRNKDIVIQGTENEKITFEMKKEEIEDLIYQLVQNNLKFSAIYPTHDNLETKFFKMLGGNRIG
ncbi:ABC-2 type transport system ATP-binding protein [Terribacillus saccharophilus]|uniref:ABC-2 type transport system ATP-binding protein n=1 Tax=Terribacillus saccharophilus TaxID=361277 RepID=A0AAX2EJM2_9BACI|nr:ABC-2 type transport system ATP-binding protein [Terribacillus saccharophilus]